MKQFFQWMNQDENIRSAGDAFLKPGCHSIYGLSGSVKSALVAKVLHEGPRQVVLVVPSREQAAAWQADLAFLVPNVKILDFPVVDKAVFTTTAKSLDRMARQMEALGRLRQGDPVLVLAAPEEAAQYVMAPQRIDDAAIDVEIQGEYDRDDLLQHLVNAGYERVDMVERRGHFSVRGDIVDVFAVNEPQPLRLAFFGDELESIRSFDVDTQKSLNDADRARILPVSLTTADDEKYTLLDYVEEGTIIWDEPNRVREGLKKILKESDDYKGVLASWKNMVSPERAVPQVVLSLMAQSVPDMFIDQSFSFAAKMMASFQKQFNLLEEEVGHWRSLGNTIVFVINSKERIASLKAWMKQHDLAISDYDDEKSKSGGMYIVEGEIHDGFELPYAKVVAVAERDVFGTQKKRLRHRVAKGQEISVFTSLKSGDYVVHEVHGIGRYMGIKTIEMDGVHKDYLEIHYAGKDILYVPTDQLSLLQRYIGNEGDTPKLQKMGGSDWQKIRSKAQKSITDLAEKLVALYAKREVVPGYAFPPDTPFQKEFEEAFPYEETEDQLKAVSEIKGSMEKPTPMDRLVCGDVGFGKTEVAMRAIFKAVTAGKQVAVLVPTTVLSQQHFQTFMERFGPFGVHVEVLNRFRSYKEKKSILARTLTGDIDVLIGTHSLLNKNVKFKSLGLLVVDEEQRFGVAQKEKWKAWAAHIDVLSLSATPIPRTLHMSLVNLREMSVIESPPTDRFPVQTYVAEYDARIVSDAIMREKRRGGQVFFVYNRVASIERMKDELQALLPDITIGIAHGQMAGTMLESMMFDFYEGKYDVLLCSSLVENGLDVANANTIIIYDADHFGLSQLYQMRGRVGRSHRMAYAYFLYRRDKVLSEVAEKRLQAIKEFTELGSGFKIAMRDLEIRGAGNLLGREQHGNIASVGFAMYCHMLEEAIAKAQTGKEVEPPPPETVMEIHVDAFIDNEYIQNGGQKIDMYQRLAVVSSKEELDELRRELEDRYGRPSPYVEKLLQVTETRLEAKAQGMVLIAQKKDILEIKWRRVFDMPDLSKLEKPLRSRFRLIPSIPVMVRVSLAGVSDILDFIQTLLTAFSSLRKGDSRD